VFVSKRHALATDGRILAIVPVKTDAEDEAGWMSPDALKHARKVSGKGLDSIRIGLNGAQILPDGTTMQRPEKHNPPRVFSLLRKAHRGGSFTIGINASYLKSLADSLGSEEVILSCNTPNEAVLVRPLKTDPGAVGLIMPIQLKHRKVQ
jgi:hypothetical protein